MEELLVVIAQFFLELLFDGLSFQPFDWVSDWLDIDDWLESPYALCAVFCILGVGVGWASLHFFPHTLLHHGWLRIANLGAAPLLSAYVGQGTARRRAANGSLVVPRERFWMAFWFSLGVTATRFAFAQR